MAEGLPPFFYCLLAVLRLWSNQRGKLQAASPEPRSTAPELNISSGIKKPKIGIGRLSHCATADLHISKLMHMIRNVGSPDFL